MIRGEVGTRPLLVEIIKRVISYVKNLKTRPSSTASKALDFEYTYDISPNIIKFVDKLKHSHKKRNSLVTRAVVLNFYCFQNIT